MNLPHLPLLHAYGNESVLLEKAAGYHSLVARAANGMINANRSLNARQREEQLRHHAERMNEAFRALEDRKMAPVREGAQHRRMPFILMAMRPGEDPGIGMGMGGHMGLGPPLQGSPRYLTGEDVPLGMDEGMVRMASAIGGDLAVYSFDKEAGMGAAVGSLFKGVGKGLGAAGAGMARGLGGGAMRMGQSVAAAPGAMKNFAVGKLQSAGTAMGAAKGRLSGALESASKGIERTGNRIQGKLEGFGQSMQAKGTGVAPVTPPLSQMSSGQRQLAVDARAARMKANGVTPGGAQVGGSTQPAHPAAAPPQATPAAPAAAPPAAGPPAAPGAAPGGEGGGFDLQKAWDRTGLSNGRYKWKLPMLAAGGLAAAGLYAGAKKGFEVLGREPEPARYNSGGAIPAYGVNEYGTPDRSTPFMT